MQLISCEKKADINYVRGVYAIGIAIVGVFCFYNIFSNVGLLIAGVLGLLLSLFVLDECKCILLTIFLTPCIMMIKPISSNTALVGYFMLLVEIRGIFLTKKLQFSRKILPYVAFTLLTSVLYRDTSLFFTFLRNLSFFLLISHAVCNHNKFCTSEWKQVGLKAFCNGVLANLVTGVIYEVIRGGGLYSGYFAGIRNDRNFFSTILLVAIAVSFYLIIQSSKMQKQSWLFRYVCIGCYTLGGILSGSRTFLIGLVLLLVIALPYLLSPRQIFKLFLFAAVGAIVLMRYGEGLTESLDSLLLRFQSEDVRDGNGRFVAWEFYLKQLVSSPINFLFGNGNALQYIQSGLIDVVEHNSYLEILSTYGVLGFISRMVVYIDLWSKIAQNNVCLKPYCLLPLLAAGVGFFAISSGTSDQFNITLMVSFMAMSYSR